jgi:hypothetical protein
LLLACVSLKVSCRNRLLGAYVIKSVEEALRYADEEPPTNEPIFAVFDFTMGRDLGAARVLPYRLSRGTIRISRYELDPGSQDLGLFKIKGEYLDGIGNAFKDDAMLPRDAAADIVGLALIDAHPLDEARELPKELRVRLWAHLKLIMGNLNNPLALHLQGTDIEE